MKRKSYFALMFGVGASLPWLSWALSFLIGQPQDFSWWTPMASAFWGVFSIIITRPFHRSPSDGDRGNAGVMAEPEPERAHGRRR